SLLNALLKENKAIVTDIPGTTRDVIEASINLGNITLHLLDTAGIRTTSDIVEQLGVKRSYDALEQADLILLVLDGSDDFTEEDAKLLEMVKNKCHIVIINKNDLPTKWVSTVDAVSMNTKDNASISNLEQKIIEVLAIHQLQNKDITYISNARQIEKLNLALKAIEEAIDTILVEQTIDFVDIYIRKAWLYLGEIVGETSTDNLLDELFSKFCLGK
ncbi:MAG: 50S ribosome-binding GTPase, partial [Anaeroplasma bactoclasticum]|nr:50S ribosome-binding GTPase [Anaeroplasma bactoclasticum]